VGRIVRAIAIVPPLIKEDYFDNDPFSAASTSTSPDFDEIFNGKNLRADHQHPVVGYNNYRSAADMDWFWIAYWLVKGLGDKTIGHGSTYRATFCYFNTRDIIETWTQDVPTHATALDFESMVTSITASFQKVDPMADECIAAYDEYWIAALEYGHAFTDLMILCYNFLYHAPNIYIAIEEIVAHF
jgi:hypothetical protein